jgi:pyridoxal phosphate enzyme (YggS family)
VDSLRLLEAIQKEAARQNICQNILLEINIGQEENKTGFTICEAWDILERIANFPNIAVKGLMAIPPICAKAGDNDKFFQEMYSLTVDITAKKGDNVSMEILSMGMSDDFADAIRCGSTMIRVGTAIFGARQY